MGTKRTHTHTVDPKTGKPKVVEEKPLPRHLRTHTPDQAYTFTEGPTARLFGRRKAK